MGPTYIVRSEEVGDQLKHLQDDQGMDIGATEEQAKQEDSRFHPPEETTTEKKAAGDDDEDPW